ncbi:MAG: carboxypeptidase-like regulatory domain-containing protein, partial [Candidatus Staskawiczbacteria bacterium]|nr:carboxypeptidase-like regulatory domain-containing protein [Candidatus Staskawiczbacteria bacterium]
DHVFVWASATDLGTTEDSTVYIRVRPNDGTVNADAWATTTAFGIDNVAPIGYSVLIDQAYINNANKTAISFAFIGAEVGTTYNYSFTLVPYTPVSSSGTISSASQQFTGIDLSGLGDGTVTLTAYLTDTAGNQGSNATDTKTKDTVAPEITIVNPDTAWTRSKTITASTSEGTLTMSNIANSTCDGTLTFTTYADQTFTDGSDNGSKVCYRAVDTAGNTTYTMSANIAGIITGSAGGGEVVVNPTPTEPVTPPSSPTTEEQATPETIAQQITNITQQIGQITQQIADFFGNQKPPTVTVPEETPSAFIDVDVLSVNPLSGFALSPIGTDIGFFADKLPSVRKTLDALSIDINNLSDVKKLSQTDLYLPGLTQTILPSTEISQENNTGTQGIPLAELSANALARIPTNLVFASTAGGLIDFSPLLAIDTKGATEEKIKTISGKPIHLTIRPDKPASNVTGLVIVKSLAQSSEGGQNAISKLFSAALAVANPQSSSPAQTNAKSGLLVQKFAYVETRPGIFTADISAPVTEGEYEITTIVEYKDASITPTQSQLIAVVDPEGYVYRQMSDGKLRIQNATVSIYQLNSETKVYELWPADKFMQNNPIITNDTGKYSFLVPEGTYYMTASAPNYRDYKSDVFLVQKDNGVNMDIELKKKSWLPDWLNWSLVVMILLAIIVLVFILNYIKGRKTNYNK